MGFIAGLFNDHKSAERAYQAAAESGYRDDEINVIMSEQTRNQHYGNNPILETTIGNKAAEGAAIGGAIGGALGAMMAAVAAVGTTLVLPGIGFVIAGPIAAAIAGAGAGGVSIGLVGALIGWGIPNHHLKVYQQDIRQGSILIAVEPKSDQDLAKLKEDWQKNPHQRIIG
jgi:hypothetical protein